MASPGSPQPVTDLTVNVKAAPESPVKTWTLTCEPVGGDHPDPSAACKALAAKKADPFTPVPKGSNCTMIYGGPEQATVTGTWRGKRVDATFSRKDGCELSRWTNLDPVLGKVPPVR